MEKIEFYQRSAVIENIFIEIFSNFSNEYHKIFDLVVYFQKNNYIKLNLYFMEKIEFYQRTVVIENY